MLWVCESAETRNVDFLVWGVQVFWVDEKSQRNLPSLRRRVFFRTNTGHHASVRENVLEERSTKGPPATTRFGTACHKNKSQ